MKNGPRQGTFPYIYSTIMTDARTIESLSCKAIRHEPKFMKHPFFSGKGTFRRWKQQAFVSLGLRFTGIVAESHR